MNQIIRDVMRSFACVAIGLSATLTGCNNSTSSPPVASGRSPAVQVPLPPLVTLSEAQADAIVLEARLALLNAEQSGLAGPDIPRSFWGTELANLNPLRLTADEQGNIDIALTNDGKYETGLIAQPTPSGDPPLPQDGEIIQPVLPDTGKTSVQPRTPGSPPVIDADPFQSSNLYSYVRRLQ